MFDWFISWLWSLGILGGLIGFIFLIKWVTLHGSQRINKILWWAWLACILAGVSYVITLMVHMTRF